MPEGFGDDFAAAWKHHVELMEPLRVLVPADCFALEALVHAHLDLRRAQAAVAEDGAFYMHGKLQKKHPACAIAADADRRYMSWLAKFGLTPVDRERVSPVPEERPPSPWAEFAEAD